MSDRLTRKEIKQQDQFQTTMSRLLEAVQVHRQKIIAGLVALVVAVIAVAGIMIWLEQRELAAQERLAEAIEIFQAPVGERPPGTPADAPVFETEAARQAQAVQAFEAIEDEYGSTDAAAVALLYLGEIAASEGETERARDLWQQFVDRASDESMLGAQARLNLIALDREAGQGETVVARLEPMLAEEEPPLPRDLVLYELAQTLEEMGETDRADGYYQRLVDEHATSPYA